MHSTGTTVQLSVVTTSTAEHRFHNSFNIDQSRGFRTKQGMNLRIVNNLLQHANPTPATALLHYATLIGHGPHSLRKDMNVGYHTSSLTHIAPFDTILSCPARTPHEQQTRLDHLLPRSPRSATTSELLANNPPTQISSRFSVVESRCRERGEERVRVNRFAVLSSESDLI